MKICTVIGARPQFIKAAIVSSKMREERKLNEIIIHTGQHYDDDMSRIFFRQLKLKKEKYNLMVGSGLHGVQTSKMLVRLEEIFINECPDLILVYGDTNSTLAGALAGSKLNIPIAHVEAGMRSFNKRMPEEINRVITDHICDLNFCSCQDAIKNLKNEGLGNNAYFVGDVMLDCIKNYILNDKNKIMNCAEYNKDEFILFTCHRAENTDNELRLKEIFRTINDISKEKKILFPAHPRTIKQIINFGIILSKSIKILPPVGYFEMIKYESKARLIITDSGGIQKEAFFLNVPCITIRDETEWNETVDAGWNILTGAKGDKIKRAVNFYFSKKMKFKRINPYGNGCAAIKIINKIKEFFDV